MGKALRERVRELRMDKGWNTQELADRVGVDRTYISKIESGERENVTMDVFLALCAALEYSPDALLADLGVPLPSLAERPAWERDLARAMEYLPLALRESETQKLRLLGDAHRRWEEETAKATKRRERGDPEIERREDDRPQNP